MEKLTDSGDIHPYLLLFSDLSGSTDIYKMSGACKLVFAFLQKDSPGGISTTTIFLLRGYFI